VNLRKSWSPTTRKFVSYVTVVGQWPPRLTVNDLAENRRHGFGIYGQGYVDAIREAAARRNVPTQ
jgi:hypothetical protein